MMDLGIMISNMDMERNNGLMVQSMKESLRMGAKKVRVSYILQMDPIMKANSARMKLTDMEHINGVMERYILASG